MISDYDTIVDLFNSFIYVIPENQRGYSWTAQQWDELVEDINFDPHNSGDYNKFMGQIICSNINEKIYAKRKKTYNKYLLEDGQQRLVTFSIMCRAFSKITIQLHSNTKLDDETRQEMKEISEELSNVFMTQPKTKQDPNISLIQFSRDEFEKTYRHILFDEKKPSIKTRSQRQMLSCYNYFLDYANSITDTKNNCVDITDFTGKLLNSCVFQATDLESAEIDKYLTFDAINSRGLKLSQFDKVKNYSLFIINLGNPNLKITKNYLEGKWYDSLENLGYYDLYNTKNEDSFINDFLNVWMNKIIKIDNTHRDFRHNFKSLVNNQNKAKSGEFDSFVKLWTEYSKGFAFIACKSPARPRYKKHLEDSTLENLQKIDWLNLKGTIRTLLTTTFIKFNTVDFENTIELLEKFIFRVYGICGFRVDKFKVEILNLSHEVYFKGLTYQNLSKEICSLLISAGSLQQCAKKLNDGSNKYSWSQLYYFIHQYEESFYKSNSHLKLTWSKNAESIEHILPQEHRQNDKKHGGKIKIDEDGKYWQKIFPDKVTADGYKHRLGNLVLTKQNSSLGRMTYSKKLKLYLTSKKATFSEGNLPNVKKWDEKQIINREDCLIKFAIERWSTNCCIDNGSVSWKGFNEKEIKYTITNNNCIKTSETKISDEGDFSAEEQ